MNVITLERPTGNEISRLPNGHGHRDRLEVGECEPHIEAVTDGERLLDTTATVAGTRGHRMVAAEGGHG